MHNSIERTPIRAHLTDHMVIVNAQAVETGPTRRPAAVLIWSTTDQKIAFSDPKGNLLFEGKAALVAPEVIRRLRTTDSTFFSLNFEPGNRHFLPLSRLVARQDFMPLKFDRFSELSDELQSRFELADYKGIEELSDELALTLLPHTNAKHLRDERIDLLLPLLESNQPPELNSLAQMLHLSKDRLSHLFADDIGMPLRSYVLWRRYRRALLALQSGEKIATVAHRVGFYDHAQMSRTFLTLFGYSPSILKCPKFIRISGIQSN
ncbi:MAG: helix-turn-helix transcriptional regulator [Acinetobacter sp.]